jgi:hypothetical protein
MAMGLLSEDKKQLAKREAMTQIIFHGTNPDEADGQDCLVGDKSCYSSGENDCQTRDSW